MSFNSKKQLKSNIVPEYTLIVDKETINVNPIIANQWKTIGQEIDGDQSFNFTGYSVSTNFDGKIIAVGSWGNSVNGYRSGYTRIFEYDGTNWVQLGSNINGETDYSNNGKSVRLNGIGNTVIIAELGFDNGNKTSTASDDSGKVKVYEYTNNNWIQKGTSITGQTGDLAGLSVDINFTGNRIAVAAPNNDSNGINCGQVRIFDYIDNNWVQVGSDILGNQYQKIGQSLALNYAGDIVAFSSAAYYTDDNGYGIVKIYKYNGTDWVQKGSDINVMRIGGYTEEYGIHVSVNGSGDKIVIGNMNDGPETDTTTTSKTGKVKIFEYNGSDWIQIGQDILGETPGDQSGLGVSMNHNGDIIAIGSINNIGGGTANSKAGHVRIFKYNGTIWEQLGLDIDSPTDGDNFGRSLELNFKGNMVVIGDWLNDGFASNAGTAQVWEIIPSEITYTLYTKNVPDGTLVPYTITGVTTQDINNDNLTGTFEVYNETAYKTFNLVNTMNDGDQKNMLMTLDNAIDVSTRTTLHNTAYRITITSDKEYVNEGENVTFTLTSPDTIPNGYSVKYQFIGVTPQDIGITNFANMKGVLSFNNNVAQKIINVAYDSMTEGQETLTLIAGNGSKTIYINDTSQDPTYQLTSTANTSIDSNGNIRYVANEGDSFDIILTTTNLPDLSYVGFQITGISPEDIGYTPEVPQGPIAVQGGFFVSNNSSKMTINVNADGLVEGSEILKFTINKDDFAETSLEVYLADTSTQPIAGYQLVYEGGVNDYGGGIISYYANEGETAPFRVNTVNVPNGTLIPYTITGVTSEDISGASLNGNLTIFNNTASISLNIAADLKTEGTENLSFTIQTLDGDTRSTNVNIIDKSITPQQICYGGGDWIIDGQNVAVCSNISVNGSVYVKNGGSLWVKPNYKLAIRHDLIVLTDNTALYGDFFRFQVYGSWVMDGDATLSGDEDVPNTISWICC